MVHFVVEDIIAISILIYRTSEASDEEQGRQDKTDYMDELHKMVTSDLNLYDIAVI